MLDYLGPMPVHFSILLLHAEGIPLSDQFPQLRIKCCKSSFSGYKPHAVDDYLPHHQSRVRAL